MSAPSSRVERSLALPLFAGEPVPDKAPADIADIAAADTPPVSTSELSPGLSSKPAEGFSNTILVVEDDPFFRAHLKRLFQGCAFELAFATNYADAMTLFEEKKPFFVLADNQLEGRKKGMALVEDLMTQKGFTNIIVISNSPSLTMPEGISHLRKVHFIGHQGQLKLQAGLVARIHATQAASFLKGYPVLEGALLWLSRVFV